MIRSLIKQPTTLGFLALLLWATASSTASFLSTLPPFEVLMFVFLINSCTTLTKISVKNEWKTLNISWKTWIIVVLGVGLQQIFYIFAFHLSPPAETDVIIYLWHLMALGFSSLVFKDKFKISYGLASLLGLSAILLLSYESLSLTSIAPGHLFALLCAVSWSLYTVLSRRLSHVGTNVLGVSCLVGFITTFFLHMTCEEFTCPNLTEALLLLYYSFGISFGAYILWTKAIQKGNASYLTLSAYMKPVVSLFLLCSFGFAVLNLNLILAALLVLSGGLISHPGFTTTMERLFDPIRQAFLPIIGRYNKESLVKA